MTFGRVGVVPFLIGARARGALGGEANDVTPAHVDGGAGLVFGKRSISFSFLKMPLNFMTPTPVLNSSGTIGGPSTIVIRRVVDSSFRTSSRNGA